MLGHHKGDEQENIITNIMKGRESILSLSGMAPEGRILGVKVWRPLMPYTKDVVFHFAHRYGVPYTLDTTPRWSNRGKLRRELQPMLASLFGSGYLKNLSALGQDSAEVHTILYDLLFKPVWDTVQRTEVAVALQWKPEQVQRRLFWKETLRHVFHSMGATAVSEKSLKHFLRRLRGDTHCHGYGVWVSLKKELPSLLLDGPLPPPSSSHPYQIGSLSSAKSSLRRPPCPSHRRPQRS